MSKIPTFQEFDLKRRRREAAIKGAETRRRNKEAAAMKPRAKKELPEFMEQVSQTLLNGELTFHGDYCELTLSQANKKLSPQWRVKYNEFWLHYKLSRHG